MLFLAHKVTTLNIMAENEIFTPAIRTFQDSYKEK
ncbi:hypothetical protein AVENLUH5627_00938 [Acinetobacter venetianus]|uniref:Uncharacterized protein n=1 Tax=Acinetobacter venetianus TaxID=52133 RepID=A0A150I0A5_9GAMM|nr:hypothetical protein AVENLUH5627_00938 [Acinetobacter venetianus]